jgi:N-hydroxyarylamine O-acetyltransferase
MPHAIQLDRYFARIGYDGPRLPTLDVLRAIQRLHPQSIPFENLDPLTGRRVQLDPAAIEAKLVDGRRGGYCFEQNRLFAQALAELGFHVTPLIARVMWGRDANAVTARTHMLLRIDLDDVAWIADVGFGRATPTGPLRIVTGEPQHTPHETFRLADAWRGALDLEVNSGDRWTKTYRFDLQPAEWIDYEVANWYTSTWPESLFVNDLVVCNTQPEGRTILLNTKLSVTDTRGGRAERTLADAAELATCLRDVFGIDAAGFDLADVFRCVAERDALAQAQQASAQ